jgi:hypothetical protein
MKGDEIVSMTFEAVDAEQARTVALEEKVISVLLPLHTNRQEIRMRSTHRS